MITYASVLEAEITKWEVAQDGWSDCATEAVYEGNRDGWKRYDRLADAAYRVVSIFRCLRESLALSAE